MREYFILVLVPFKRPRYFNLKNARRIDQRHLMGPVLKIIQFTDHTDGFGVGRIDRKTRMGNLAFGIFHQVSAEVLIGIF